MTNNSTVVDMHQFVQARAGRVFTTSQGVADAFGKQHYHVLAKVRELDCSDHFLTHNFSWVQFDHRGNTYDAVEMTKDGFMFLVMGFTGKKAAAIKEGYIGAFNWMSEQLDLQKTAVDNVIDEALGPQGARVLSSVIRCKTSGVPAQFQRSAMSKLSHALHARFSVPRMEDIPSSQMDAACNFIGAYALEGEFLGKEEVKPVRLLDIDYPVEALAKRRPEMLIETPGERTWLDVTLHDLRDIRGEFTPCELILWELSRAGYQVEGALCELRTYRNKLREFQSWMRGMAVMVDEPHRYAVKLEGVA